AGTLMCTGDILAQVFIERKSRSTYDLKRSGRFFVFGACVVGPALRTWYGILDKIVVTTKKWGPLAKVTLDQSLFAPVFGGIFLYSMTLWGTKSHETSVLKLKQDYTTILLNNYKLWPAAQIVNFYFIPLQHRILYVNFIAVIWNTYLAYEANTEVRREPVAEKSS
ncbi:hypothetical protein CAPTEDRAFT_92614, partial [Capitella teleta]